MFQKDNHHCQILNLLKKEAERGRDIQVLSIAAEMANDNMKTVIQKTVLLFKHFSNEWTLKIILLTYKISIFHKQLLMVRLRIQGSLSPCLYAPLRHAASTQEQLHGIKI